jgi:hypothetical protein
LVSGYRHTQLVYVVAQLGLADLLAEGPKATGELARAAGAHAASLHRLLRGLATLGVVSEGDDGRFSLAPVGELLRAGGPGSLRAGALQAGEAWYPAWGALLHTSRTGESGLGHVFGTQAFEHFARRPELGEHFNASMARASAELAPLLVEAYDFARFTKLVDVGGGHGALLAGILKATPRLEGVVFDLPHVVAGAAPRLAEAGVADRCELVGGDFFESVPDGADGHLLKWIVHDWDDDQAVRILDNCRRALGASGTLLLVERLLPRRAVDAPETIAADLTMLVLSPSGRERSEAEFRDLLAAAGLRLTRVLPVPAGRSSNPARLHLIESVRAR